MQNYITNNIIGNTQCSLYNHSPIATAACFNGEAKLINTIGKVKY